MVFADNCASCHSSKQPEGIAKRTDAYRQWMRQEVLKPDFLDNNFLSNDDRNPVSLIKTNACSALATNATRGHIWDNFSSETYKTLPAVGAIEVAHPIDGTTRTRHARGRARLSPHAVADRGVGDRAVFPQQCARQVHQ